MAAAADLQARLGDQRGLGPAQLRGAFGERGEAVERGQRRGGGLQRAESVDELRQHFFVEFALARQRLLARPEHLVLEALELGRDEALGVLDGLPADVVLRHASACERLTSI